MRNRIFKIISLIWLLTGFLVVYGDQTGEPGEIEKLDNLFRKKDVKVLVIDSGLGGLAVTADMVERLKTNGVFASAEVIFYNVQPHLESGFNVIKNREQKIKVFENVLESIDRQIKPDILLIACNTLSVLYPDTRYFNQLEIPVITIVDTGVELVRRQVRDGGEGTVILFATETTVEEGIHKKKLIAYGFPPDRVIMQACPRLAGSIERGHHSGETLGRVKTGVDSAVIKMRGPTEPVWISLNCTHYGYVSDLFREAFRERNIPVLGILDPNPLMADVLFTDKFRQRYPDTPVVVRVFSQPVLPEERIASIAGLIRQTSPQTAEALVEYEWTPDFFEWKSIVEPD